MHMLLVNRRKHEQNCIRKPPSLLACFPSIFYSFCPSKLAFHLLFTVSLEFINSATFINSHPFHCHLPSSNSIFVALYCTFFHI
uniref:Uncharacterized protein n=1 Tax=Rhizophora mucronata TaxID=61149 RepID=A0A2P2K745_RHIMU